jgi:hypothetical protein
MKKIPKRATVSDRACLTGAFGRFCLLFKHSYNTNIRTAIIVCLIFATCSLVFGNPKTIISSDHICKWIYTPGTPTIQVADTVNWRGIRLEWSDTDYRICENNLQPIRIFYVALPAGSAPKLNITSLKTEPLNSGLAGRPPAVRPNENSPHKVWAELSGIEEWRGFRLARIEVNLQIGNNERSDVLREIELEVQFTNGRARTGGIPRESRLLKRMTVNGEVAATWWEDDIRRSTLDETAAWPAFDLTRLTVTETGLYKIEGSSLAASGLVGKSSSSIRLFGNGGRLLPSDPIAETDSVLKENAIWVDDGGDNRFDQEDNFLFFGRGVKGADYCDNTYLYGWAHQSPFTTENVYFVGADESGTIGKRMSSLSTSGGGRVITTSVVRDYYDQDAFIYSGPYQSESGLRWYNTTISSGTERSFAIYFEAVTGGGSPKLILGSYGAVGGRLAVFVNDASLSVGGVSNRITMNIPVGELTAGNNLIRIQNNSSSDLQFNYFEFEFERTISAPLGSVEFYAPQDDSGLFRYTIADLGTTSYLLDVTNPLEPRLATGNTFADSSAPSYRKRYYAVRSDKLKTPGFRGTTARQDLDYMLLRDPVNSADMIILTFDEGYQALDSLREFHETYREEPLRTMRVRLTDVFDEFGWGVHDVVAIRNFLKYAYERWQRTTGGEPLRYVLFVGDGDFDYRNILSSADANWMPPWEEGESCRDDFFVIFGSSTLPQCLTGRWPVQSVAELQAVVTKTIAYANQPLYGPWKNTATFAADDEWKNGNCGEYSHTEQAESLINSVLPDYFTFKKIYECLYPFRASATGATKPDATQDLLETINRGTLLVTYTGHGNERVWTDEQMFVMDRDKNLLDNWRMWPLFLAATCTWGGFDRPLGRCFPEILLTDPSDGAIASVAATRFTYVGSNNTFVNAYYSELFRPGLAARSSFGEALLVAKSTGSGSANAREYHVFGDPALRLATPEYFARVTQSDDSLQALSLFHLAGEVSQSDSGAVWSDFQGVVEARVYDTEDSAAYYWCGNTSSPPFYYRLPGNAIFRGRASVENGRFEIVFRVPRDVRFGGTNAKVSLYFYGQSASDEDSADGIGIEEGLAIASVASSEIDSIAPVISVWLETSSFRSGDLVSSAPKLHVDLADSSGINLSGEVGHKITVHVDDAQAEDITPYFNYDLDSYTRGSLDKIIGPLTEGEHQLVIEGWDSFNNLNRASLTFTVGKSGEAGYAVRDVYTWPNPMKDFTHFTYYLTQSGTRRVSVKVFTLSGKLVYEMDGLDIRGPAFNSNADRPWDGRDREGHTLANGVYFYRIRAEHTDGPSAEAIGKLVILR